MSRVGPIAAQSASMPLIASSYETSKALPSRGIGSPAQYNMPATAAPALFPAPAMVAAESPAIGFSTGGAKDLNSDIFRAG